MLLVTGEVERVQDREAGRAPNTWTEHTIVVRDWGSTTYCTVGRDFGPLPAPGERVALEVSVRAYVSQKRQGEAGHGFTAHRRNAEAEASLFNRTPSAVKAS